MSPPSPRPQVPPEICPCTKMAGDNLATYAKSIANWFTVDFLVQTMNVDPALAKALIDSEGEPEVDILFDGESDGKVVALNPDNRWPITVDNVPSSEGTRSRFPGSGSFWRGIFGEPSEWKVCRAYEQALRDWASSTKAYDAYRRAITAWDAASLQATIENERIMRKDFPNQLQAFQVVEARRKDEWREACRAHAISEETRRAAWVRQCEEHQNMEARRKEDWENERRLFSERERSRKQQWEHACRAHEEAEKKRLHAWVAEWQGFAVTVKAHGAAINAFLEEHPDIEILFEEVDAERVTSPS